jgi:RimJ/RimL family protein N-acetyltransferase
MWELAVIGVVPPPTAVLIRPERTVGWVGYWKRTWRDEQVFEIGWAVLPAFHGRGIAGRATEQAVATARGERSLRYVHAFPSVDNAPSNAICRKLGFALLEECSSSTRRAA